MRQPPYAYFKICALALLVAACGGGGGSGDSTPSNEETITEPGTNPGTNPGTDTGTNPGTDTGTNPGTDTGTNPGTDTGTPDTSGTTDILAIDGYLQNALYCVDANSNRACDADESPARTDMDGRGTVPGGTTHDILVIADTDTLESDTQGVPGYPIARPFILTAPAGARTVTPFTTLAHQLATHTNRTIQDVLADELSGLGLEGVDITDFDPIADGSSEHIAMAIYLADAIADTAEMLQDVHPDLDMATRQTLIARLLAARSDGAQMNMVDAIRQAADLVGDNPYVLSYYDIQHNFRSIDLDVLTRADLDALANGTDASIAITTFTAYDGRGYLKNAPYCYFPAPVAQEVLQCDEDKVKYTDGYGRGNYVYNKNDTNGMVLVLTGEGTTIGRLGYATGDWVTHPVTLLAPVGATAVNPFTSIAYAEETFSTLYSAEDMFEELDLYTGFATSVRDLELIDAGNDGDPEAAKLGNAMSLAIDTLMVNAAAMNTSPSSSTTSAITLDEYAAASRMLRDGGLPTLLGSISTSNSLLLEYYERAYANQSDDFIDYHDIADSEGLVTIETLRRELTEEQYFIALGETYQRLFGPGGYEWAPFF